jgi:transcription antitermination factor NusG
VHCKLDDKIVLFRSGAIAHILKVPNEAELISELSQVYQGLDLGAELKEHAYLPQGTRVKITSGPFNGLIGRVSETTNVTEIVLQVTFLRQAVSVSVTADQIEILRGK